MSYFSMKFEKRQIPKFAPDTVRGPRVYFRFQRIFSSYRKCTTTHGRQPSKLEYIAARLADLVSTTTRLGISSLALPAIGCGLGGLQWTEVKPLIEAAFAQQPAVRVVLFGPR